MKKTIFSLVLMVAAASAAFAGAPTLSGDYIEVRTNHILGGGCTYSAEADYDGNRAVLAWRIGEGELTHLSVVAVVLGEGNLQLGNHARETVLFVDASATPDQQKMLADVFTGRYGEVFGAVKSVKVAEITFRHSGEAAYEVIVANEVTVVTRTMSMADHEPNCDQLVWYAPFTGDASVTLVQTDQHSYTGKTLKSNWSAPNKRSAYVGTFSFTDQLAAR